MPQRVLAFIDSPVGVFAQRKVDFGVILGIQSQSINTCPIPIDHLALTCLTINEDLYGSSPGRVHDDAIREGGPGVVIVATIQTTDIRASVNQAFCLWMEDNSIDKPSPAIDVDTGPGRKGGLSRGHCCEQHGQVLERLHHFCPP